MNLETTLSELSELKRQGRWADLIKSADKARDLWGPDPDLLFECGFACAQLNDFTRAHRLMVDALLSRFEENWVPWLAAVYERLGLSLPMWVLANWMSQHHATMNGVQALYERAYAKLAHEMQIRGLSMPPAQKCEYDIEAAQKFNLKLVEHMNAGSPELALQVGKGALLFYPFDPSLLINTSLAFKRLERLHEAGLGYLSAFALDPLGYGCVSNFGNLLLAAGSPHDAMYLLEAGAIVLREDAIVWSNLAISYNALRIAPWEAEIAARQAIKIDPNLATSWSALANALGRQGRMQESLSVGREAARLDPSRENENLFALNFADELSQEEVAHAHFKSAAVHLNPKKLEHNFHVSRKDRLNVGFVSGDLLSHPVAYFIEPVLQRLNQHADVFVYHNRPVSEEDAVTERIKSFNLSWRNVYDLSDENLRKQIIADQIDVLVDLSGHTACHRLNVFAMRSAPVQVTYLGYPNTTGMAEMDYILLHDKTVKPGTEKLYSEKIYSFKDASAVYLPLIRRPEMRSSDKYAVNDTPAMTNGYVTFGTLNNVAKINSEVVSVWSEILKAAPSAKLLVESPGLHQREFAREFRSRFSDLGVEADRLLLFNRDPAFQYLRYHQVDIALDPFPYGGGTTSCDTLWMGVPLVTFYSEKLMSRTGYSLLHSIGRPEIAHDNLEGYKSCAIELSADVVALDKLRKSLRKEFEASPLMDYEGFTQRLAQAFAEMWLAAARR